MSACNERESWADIWAEALLPFPHHPTYPPSKFVFVYLYNCICIFAFVFESKSICISHFGRSPFAFPSPPYLPYILLVRFLIQQYLGLLAKKTKKQSVKSSPEALSPFSHHTIYFTCTVASSCPFSQSTVSPSQPNPYNFNQLPPSPRCGLIHYLLKADSSDWSTFLHISLKINFLKTVFGIDNVMQNHNF